MSKDTIPWSRLGFYIDKMRAVGTVMIVSSPGITQVTHIIGANIWTATRPSIHEAVAEVFANSRSGKS